MRVLPIWMISVLCAGILVTGCHRDNDDGDVTDASSPLEFTWSADVSGYDEREFYWESAINGSARVEIVGDEFKGEVRVRIYDGASVQVFDEDWDENFADDFSDVSFTATAAPGTWRIRIDLEASSGELFLKISE